MINNQIDRKKFVKILILMFVCAVVVGGAAAMIKAKSSQNKKDLMPLSTQNPIASKDILKKPELKEIAGEQDKKEEQKPEEKPAGQNTSDDAKKENPDIKTEPSKTIPAPVSKPSTNNTPVPQPPQPTSKAAPMPAPAPKPAPIPASAPASNSFLDLVNAARKQAGLGAVKYNAQLNQAALVKSKDMAEKNYFSHTAPDGTRDLDLAKRFGYSYRAIGSNIAMGSFPDDKAVFQAWMNSPGHKANILANFGQEIGYAKYGKYYTMFIASPM